MQQKGQKNETSKLLLEPLRALKCCFHSILTKINVYFYSSECREVANGFGIKDNILIQRPPVAHKPCFWFSVWAHCKATPLVPPYHWLIKSKMMTRSALMPLCRQSCSLWTKSKPLCGWIESVPAVGRLAAEWLTCGSSFQTKPGESRVPRAHRPSVLPGRAAEVQNGASSVEEAQLNHSGISSGASAGSLRDIIQSVFSCSDISYSIKKIMPLSEIPSAMEHTAESKSGSF